MFKKILTILGKSADKAILGGIVTNVIEETKDYPKGKVDWVRFAKVLLKFSIPFILLLAFIFGAITMEDLKELIKLF